MAVCVLVGTGFGELVRVAVGRGDAVGLDDVVGVAVADGDGATEMMWLVTLDEQTTTAPPPLPDPTHWVMVTGSAAVFVDVVTVHRTRLVPPPPLPELLHWVTVAPVVLPMGEHTLVGCVPPPVPAELHWLTVAGDVVALPVMLLTMLTLHLTVPPPPLPEPLHWVTDVVSWVDGVVVVVQVGGALAAP